MNIPLKMNRDFEKAMTTLNERYGEDCLLYTSPSPRDRG